MSSSLDPLAGMSYSESEYSTYMNILPTQNSFMSDFGLPRDVLETLTNYSVSSPGMLSDDIRALEDEFREKIALLKESPGSARGTRLQALSTKQRDHLEEAELDIAAYNHHQTVVENVNGDLADKLSSLTTVHVLVCLERDNLRKFKRVAISLLVFLVIMILLGI